MNVIIQSGYRSNTTLKRIISGINDFSNRPINFVFSADEINDNEKAAVVIGIDNVWEKKICLNLTEKNIHPIIVFPSENSGIFPYTSITADFFFSVQNLTSLLIPHTKKGIAFAGFNPSSSTDIIKLKGFKQALCNAKIKFNPHHIFTSNNDISSCVKNVIKAKEEIDTIICANDIIAISILPHLPDWQNYNITSFTGMLCTQYTNPKITTVGIDYYSVGRAVLDVYNAVIKNDFMLKQSFYVKSNLIIGQTTPSLKNENLYRQAPVRTADYKNLLIYNDEVFKELDTVEMLLQKSDDVDIKILKAIAYGKTYEEISAELFLSISPLKYRIGKMLKIVGLKYKSELKNLLEKYNFFK